MPNLEKYTEAFCRTFDITAAQARGLNYQDIPAWNSIGHMNLIVALEDAFDIVFEPDDIIAFSSFEKGLELLRTNYAVEL